MESRGGANVGTDVVEDAVPAGKGRSAALIGVGGLAVALAVLPAAVAWAAPLPAGWVAAGLAGLAAVWGGGKLVALAWGLSARFVASRGDRAAVAAID